MKTPTEIIVLNTVKYGEKSLVLHCLSRDFGRRTFFVRNAAPVISLFGPMSVLEGYVVELPNLSSSMPLITKLSRSVNFPRIRNNLYKSSICIFLAELLYRTVPEAANEDGLYDWCINKLLLLEEMNSGIGNFPLLFLLELSVNLGFRPQTEDILPFVPDENKNLMSALMSQSFAEAMMIPLSGKLRNSLADSILHYLETNLDTRLNIRSLPVLREIMEGL